MKHGNDNNRNDSPANASTTETFRADCQPGDADALLEAVIRVVAVATGEEPTALDPLYWTVDPTAMAELFRGRTDPDVKVSFRYEGHEVTVRSCGEVSVTALPDAE